MDCGLKLNATIADSIESAVVALTCLIAPLLRRCVDRDHC
jgi:hypothetical protein